VPPLRSNLYSRAFPFRRHDFRMTMNAGRPQRRKAAPAGDSSSKFVRNRIAIRSMTTDASFWVPRGDPTDNVRTRSSSPSGLLCLRFTLRLCQQMGRKYASISPPLGETMVYPRRRASEALWLPKLITSRICSSVTVRV